MADAGADELALLERELRREAEDRQLHQCGSRNKSSDLTAFEERIRTEVARQLAQTPGYSFTEDFVSDVEGNWHNIRDDYRGKPDIRMLEIGSFQGRSTIWFLENILTHPTASIVCIDKFEWGEARFDHNIRVSGLGAKVTKLKGFSQAHLPALPLASFDLVYVDGDHSAANVLMDGALSWLRLKPAGIMIFDDYLWKTEKAPQNRPQMAIDLFLDLFAGKYEILFRGYQVILRKNT